jgi:uncharacterized protein with beta-barrel porin domain
MAEEISPDGLTAFYEISFSNANVQRLNLESRLDDLRGGSNGFSSNMKLNGATVNLEDKAPVDGKTSKNAVEEAMQPGAENRWGVWVTGFGYFVNVDSDSNGRGYDFTTGGVVEPSLRAAWEHEFKYSALPITAGFAGIAGPTATFSGPSEGQDSAIVSAGVSVPWNQTMATYVNYDGQLGRDRYNSNAVTGGVKIAF